jgi:hypothetical protein
MGRRRRKKRKKQEEEEEEKLEGKVKERGKERRREGN